MTRPVLLFILAGWNILVIYKQPPRALSQWLRGTGADHRCRLLTCTVNMALADQAAGVDNIVFTEEGLSLRIVEIGNTLEVPDEVVEQLGDFQTYRHVPVVDDGVINIGREPESLLRPVRTFPGVCNRDGGLVPHRAPLANAGLRLHLKRLAERGNLPLESCRRYVDDGQRGCYEEYPKIDESTAQTQLLPADFDEHWIRTAVGCRRGLIQLGSGVCPAWLVAQLYIAWPHARILVLATRQSELDKFAAELQIVRTKRVISEIPVRCSPIEALLSGITLSIWENAHAVEVRLGADFVIVLDATQVEHKKANDQLWEIDSRLGVFGFRQGSEPLAPRTEAYMTAAFGPTVLEIPRHGYAKPHIQVAWITINGGHTQVRGATGQAVFREGIEVHRHRNEKITRIAKAVAAGDANEIKQFPGIHQWWIEMGSVPLPVLVACASARQAHALRNQAGTGQILNDKTVINEEGALCWPGRGIRFSVSDRKHRAAGYSVVINAAGGDAPSHLSISLCPAAQRKRLLVIDFKDRHLPQRLLRGQPGKGWWELRRDWYTDHRIYDLGISEIQGQLDSFIRQFHTKASK